MRIISSLKNVQNKHFVEYANRDRLGKREGFVRLWGKNGGGGGS
ncbi:MAG: hypothetical protein U9O87_02855 [Verrucomicrobiota bacterium]|nr:hypothetical protein [Verrucomicrobiota bacterium]